MVCRGLSGGSRCFTRLLLQHLLSNQPLTSIENN